MLVTGTRSNDGSSSILRTIATCVCRRRSSSRSWSFCHFIAYRPSRDRWLSFYTISNANVVAMPSITTSTGESSTSSPRRNLRAGTDRASFAREPLGRSQATNSGIGRQGSSGSESTRPDRNVDRPTRPGRRFQGGECVPRARPKWHRGRDTPYGCSPGLAPANDTSHSPSGDSQGHAKLPGSQKYASALHIPSTSDPTKGGARHESSRTGLPLSA